jgi:hypothetical protein
VVNDHPRPVLMSDELATELGLSDRMGRRTDGGGVVVVTEAELLVKAPATAYVEWGYPDTLGRFTPTVWTGPRPE